uniref:Uncharacterized protein n=1 Tax=Anopheles merus TaxID=30066 RepID=A0A182VJA4_ANOME
DKVKDRVIYGDKEKVLVCPTCNHPTELPAGPGGIGQLPQHFVLARKIENIISQHSSSPGSSRNGSPTNCAPSSIAFAMCGLCSDEVTLTEEQITDYSEVENILFISILLKWFEQCLKLIRALDSTVTDTKPYPQQSGIEHSAGDLATLKAHKRVQLTLVVRDYEGRRLGHIGFTVQADLHFRDNDDHSVQMTIADNRERSYGLTFVPSRPGVMYLIVFVVGKLLEVFN